MASDRAKKKGEFLFFPLYLASYEGCLEVMQFKGWPAWTNRKGKEVQTFKK